jgi:hypothetical protein
MYKKSSLLVIGLLATSSFFTTGSALAANEKGNAKVAPDERASVCAAQAEKLSLKGSAADDYLSKCGKPPSGADEGSDTRLQGKL